MMDFLTYSAAILSLDQLWGLSRHSVSHQQTLTLFYHRYHHSFTSESIIAGVGVSVSLTCPYQLYSSIVTTPVAFTNTRDKKTILVCSCSTNKNLDNCGLLLSSQPNSTNLSFPCVELMSSGLWGARRKLSHYTHFCTHALASIHTLTYTQPLLSCWILALPGLTTCW